MIWRVLAITVGIVVLALGGAAVFVATYDLNDLKPRIAAAVHDATGRDLAIDGPVTIAWSLSPTIAAERVRLSNIAGGSRPDMAAVQRVEATISLDALLHRALVARSIHLAQPDILFEQASDGSPNWRFARPMQPDAPTETSGPIAGQPARMTTAIERLSVEGGVVAWRADARLVPLAIKRFAASADSPTAPIRMSGSIELLSHPIRIDAETGSAEALRLQGSSSPLPIRAHVSIDDATIDLLGKIDGLHEWREAVGSATLQAPTFSSVSDLWRLLQSGLAIVGGLTRTEVLMKRVAPEPLHDITIAISRPRSDAPVAVSVSGKTAANVAVAASANLGSISGAGLAFTDGKLSAPFADATVRGVLTVGSRPSLTAVVAAGAIDLDAASVAFRPANASAAPVATVAPAPATATEPSTPAAGKPLDSFALRTVDADVALTAARIRVGGHDLTGVDAHAKLKDGKLTVDPARVATLGGPLTGALTVDATGPAPTAHAVLHAPSLDVAEVTGGLLGIPVPVDGRAQAFADLTASGDTPHALAASLSGSAGVAMVDGTIDNRLVGQALGSAGNSLGVSAMLGRTGRGAVRCLAIRLDAHDGVANVGALVADTAPVTVEGGGTIDLGRELFDVHLRPLARLGGTGVSVPIDVSGSFRTPSIKVAASNPGAAQQIVIGALSGPRGPAEACGPALALARDGQPGPAPSAPPQPGPEAKPKKPADILRSLLR